MANSLISPEATGYYLVGAEFGGVRHCRIVNDQALAAWHD